ncbi:pyruvate,water dikinase [Saccharopolyspora erythraea NRRL 2338]|uniref:Phosphoenolpyruvate synthase n=2 Tax=Saccharopolyspora erythraea TaxID=1836 RepID=A4FR07_SACEN|nr:PEP/pyruvate-binding domain-containing protein [Saccharopolyspora erythraea]EQD83274.1 phosphoenolpyruvate synthase [Saccharopolyspora erythraea D]PFG93083.1 pyruvate,water dikinase [Saccharopolyspora erythraea NRRL 2338]CAM06482.1 phosphoenolpyruvate synthase [Saccharopolyspora erythraea NRRL 2338]
MALVVPLRDLPGANLASAGGKGANLAALVRAGFPVPSGFVVTTDAYAAVAGEPGPDTRAFRAALESAVVPEPVRAAIVAAYADLGGGPVAVRSSATAEDLPGAAFAGQQDTYLDVIGADAVVDAVRRCWGSLWSDRAVEYRRVRGVDSGQVRIAVVVQEMVPAETAGVLFTADPVSGDRERIVVDAGRGLGEAVVSGRVTPDHYVLDRHGDLRGWTPGRHGGAAPGRGGTENGRRGNRAARGGTAVHLGGIETVPGGTRVGWADADAGRSGTAVGPRGTLAAKAPGPDRLPDEVLRELARLGREAERLFGRPQDVEWAYADGRVSVLQARPMTALPPPPLELNVVQRRLASIMLEYMPVRPYPLDMSTWLPHGPAGLMGEVLAYFGLPGVIDGFVTEVDGVADRIVPPAVKPSRRLLAMPFRVAAPARRHDPARWTEDPRFVRYLERVRELASRDLTAMPWPRLLHMPREALDATRAVADLRIDYLPRTGLSLLRLLLALKVLGRSSLLMNLVNGAPTRTADANRELEALAARARSDPRLRAAVESLEPGRLADFDEFGARFEAFLTEYGHRETTSPLLVTTPTWSDAPETVLGLVKVLAAEPPVGTDVGERAMAGLLAHPLLRSPKRRARVRRWVSAARAGIAFREDSHFYFTMPLPVLRRSLLEIGGRLRDAGALGSAEDVFHLRLEGLEGVGDPAAAGGLRATASARAARRAELAGVRMLNLRSVFPDRPAGDALVSGTPASGGTDTGPVRVVRDPSEFGSLAAGDVLVCPYTNPAWTPLFQRAAAVVADSGGPASHAAIVAREYGIPAVMGTAVATSVLTDGTRVSVDGDVGRVTAADS